MLQQGVGTGQVADQPVVREEDLPTPREHTLELDGADHPAVGQQRLLEVDLAQVVPEVRLLRGA